MSNAIVTLRTTKGTHKMRAVALERLTEEIKKESYKRFKDWAVMSNNFNQKN